MALPGDSVPRQAPKVVTFAERVQAQSDLWDSFCTLWSESSSSGVAPMKATKAWQEQRCQEALADGKTNNPGSSSDTAVFRITGTLPQAPPAWAAALDTSVFLDTVTRLASVMAMPEVDIDSAWEQQDPSGGDVALSLGEDPSGGISRT